MERSIAASSLKKGMKIALIVGLVSVVGVLVGGLLGAMYVYKDSSANSYAEIILENDSSQDIQIASVDYEEYHIVVKDVPIRKQSPRIMYDTSKTTLNRNFVLNVIFADGSSLHLADLREVGSGENITIIIDLHGAHTALRKAVCW